MQGVFTNVAVSKYGTAMVNISSAVDFRSTGNGNAYGMNKDSTILLINILDCEWAKMNIKVNTVDP